MIVGLILVIIGAVSLAVKLGYISGSIWSFTWPLILIVLGLAMLFRRHRGFFWCGPWRGGREDQ